MLIRRHARRTLTETQWRARVGTQLASLQTDMAKVTALLAEDRKARQGSPWAWVLAFVVLLCSGLVVVAAIHQGLTASADATAAGRLQTQMNNSYSGSERAIRSDLASASCKESGLAAFKCHLRVANLTFGTFTTVMNDDAKLRTEQSSAYRLEVEGPAVLAFGSALGGAALGWMLTQWLTAHPRRDSGAEGENPETTLA